MTELKKPNKEVVRKSIFDVVYHNIYRACRFISTVDIADTI